MLSTPLLMALLKGINSTLFNRSILCLITGRLKCESIFVSPWPGKCLAQAITSFFCNPFK